MRPVTIATFDVAESGEEPIIRCKDCGWEACGCKCPGAAVHVDVADKFCARCGAAFRAEGKGAHKALYCSASCRAEVRYLRKVGRIR